MSNPRLRFVLGTVCASVAVMIGFGQRPALEPTVFAIRDARLVLAPGQVVDKGTLVIRDGVIDAVGAEVKPPVDAIVIEGKGLTVYPGFIDASSSWGYDDSLRRSAGGPTAPADIQSSALIATQPANRKGLTPEFTVQTALKADTGKAEAWRKAGFTAHLVTPTRGLLAGQSALVSLSNEVPRDAILRGPVALHAALDNPGGNGYPRALMGSIAHCRQTLLDAGHYQRRWAAFEKTRSAGLRPPFDPCLSALGGVLNGKMPVMFEANSRDEIHRALDFAREFKLRPIILGGQEAWQASARLAREKTPVILRLDYPDEPRQLLGRRAGNEQEKGGLPARVEKDLKRQLDERRANAGKLHATGVIIAFSSQGLPADAKLSGKFRGNLKKTIEAGLPAEAALAALTANPARMLGIDRQLGSLARGKAAHLLITDGDFNDPAAKICFVFADGKRFEYDKPRKQAKDEPKKPDDKKKEEPKKPDEKKPDVASEIEADRRPRLRSGGDVLIRNATVLTVTKGTKENTDVLVRGGKINKIGKGLKRPEGVKVIDAKGLFVMPGIIDTHCHFAISGGVNEYSLSVVPEVRVKDVINSDDVQIFRSLAGGVTTARLLHGSANVIGGQDAVIKLKYGDPASKLLIDDAPQGVKFALGENVKRTSGRFPNTRLGVEALLIRAFTEAQAYRASWEAYGKARAAGRDLPEPRRDLRLEALVGILDGRINVHCHCYRADEILMLLRIAERFKFKIRSLQHGLEAYKVAPEVAKHGASVSSFSDWWAYKIEAYDAIPFNAGLLTEAGALVCLKSDSNELVRHLYQEAAKCMKYGGMSETDALKTITLNGAIQLGLDKRIGSIEVGKDADLAIFNGHPLNSYARCELTLVEGEVYFQRDDEMKPADHAKAGPTPKPGPFKPIDKNLKGKYAIVNVTLHPGNNGAVPNATVVLERGKIVAVRENVGAKAESFPDDVTVVDGSGLHLYPGMIDAGTVLGLTELGSARETHDYAELGDFQPDLKASTAINPDSELIPVTRANGVLSVVTRPTGSVIAGQSALINLAGWVPSEMAVVDPLALHIEFPAAKSFHTGDPTAPRVGAAIARKQRELKIRRLKEVFQLALLHDKARKQDPTKQRNPRLEALVPYAKGEKAVIIQAHREQEILEALKLAEELKIKMVLSGGIDAWKVADELKKRDVPVILGPIMTLPQENYDPYDAPFTAAAKLHEKGVRFCLRSAGSSNTRNLPYEAAMSISYGLPADEGLKAVTLYPAQILGVEDKLGTVESGKIANLVLTNGDLLQASTQVLSLFINGKPLPPASKQTRLYERYRERLREVKEGLAPLGTP